MNQREDYCVLVVDDHHMLRLGLKAFALNASKFTLHWFEASSLVDALEIYRNEPEINLVLLDLNLPDSRGLQSVQQFLNQFPSVPLAVYSATEDEFVVRQALALGVIGFIPKSVTAEAMLVLLESLLVGSQDASNHNVSHTLSSKQGMHGNTVTGKLLAHEAGLTPTQLKVLEMVLAGLSNREVATECNLAIGTVKNAVSSIMLVLNVNSRSHLISLFR